MRLELGPEEERLYRAEAERLEVPPEYFQEWMGLVIREAVNSTLPPSDLQSLDSATRARREQALASMERLAQKIKERARSGAPAGTLDDREPIVVEILDSQARATTPEERAAEFERIIKGLKPPPNSPPLETLTRESFYEDRW